MDVEELDKELEMMFGKQRKGQVKVTMGLNVVRRQSSGEQNSDNEEMITVSQFRQSDPTIIDRRKIMGLKKKGQLLQRIKRELSSQNLDIQPQQNPRAHKRVNTHSSIGQPSMRGLKLTSNEKDEQTQQVIDNYQKEIQILRGQLKETRQQRRQLKQTLQGQRRFFMSQMYAKGMVIEQYQRQIAKLQDAVEGHVGAEYQMQERIRQLELESKQYKYQLQLQRLQVQQEVNQIDRIQVQGLLQQQQQEVFKFITDRNQYIQSLSIQSNNEQVLDQIANNDNITGSRGVTQRQEDMRAIHLSQHSQIIQKLQAQINQLKQFYQNKILTLQQRTIRDEQTLASKSSTHNCLQQQKEENPKSQSEEGKMKLFYSYLKKKVPSIETLRGFGIGALLISIGATLVYRRLSKP